MNGLYLHARWIWRGLESKKDGKKVNVLCIIGQNHERSVVVPDHFRNFKSIFSIVVTTLKMEQYLFRENRGKYCLKLKKGKLNTKKLLKISWINWTRALSTTSRQNQSSASLNWKKYVFTTTYARIPQSN